MWARQARREPTESCHRSSRCLDREQLIEALNESEAIVSTLGVVASRAPTEIYSRGIANTLSAMNAHGIRKLAVISAAPVGPPAEQPFFERRVAMPLLEGVFGATYEDMRRMEELLRASDVEWSRYDRLGWSTRQRPAVTAWTPPPGHCARHEASPTPTWSPHCSTHSTARTYTDERRSWPTS